jgi:hypothetical protein
MNKAEAFGAFLGLILLAILHAVIASWLVMIGIGNIHDVWNSIPALGFWDTFSFVIWFGAAISMYVNSSRSRN